MTTVEKRFNIFERDLYSKPDTKTLTSNLPLYNSKTICLIGIYQRDHLCMNFKFYMLKPLKIPTKNTI